MSPAHTTSLRCLDAYVLAHNESVRTGAPEPLEPLLADNAVMLFASGRAGPFAGRASILDAFRTDPPDDTIEVENILWHDRNTVLARYRWRRAESPGGRLYLACRGERIELLVVLPG